MLSLIDPTITVGNVISLVGTLLAFIWFVWRMSLMFTELKSELKIRSDMMWRDYCKRHGMNGGRVETPTKEHRP